MIKTTTKRNGQTIDVYDFTPQAKDAMAEKLDYLIEAVNFLLMPTEGNA